MTAQCLVNGSKMSIESSTWPRAIVLWSTWDYYLEVLALPKRTDSLPPVPWILKDFFQIITIIEGQTLTHNLFPTFCERTSKRICLFHLVAVT